jgi:hypothetical protein
MRYLKDERSLGLIEPMSVGIYVKNQESGIRSQESGIRDQESEIT